MAGRPTSNMYATIRREPEDLSQLLITGWEQAERAAAVLARAQRVFTVGIGTSYHAALHAEHQLTLAGCDARAVSSYDFAVYPPELRAGDAVAVFTHTGRKRYSLAALLRAREAGVPCLAVSGVEAAVEGMDAVLRTVAREQSAAFTASHTAALFVTAQAAFVVGRQRGRFDAGVRAEFERVPALVQGALEREAAVEEVARYALDRRIYCAGAGPDAPIALEAALKAREAAYATIDGMATEQFLHGPMVTITGADLAILIATSAPGRERTRELLAVLDGVGTRSWLVGQLPEPPATAVTFVLEELHPLLAPVVALVPIQLFACYLAHLKGANADSFRRDMAPYTEAFSRVRL